jgi:hypothetical protein
MQVLLINFCFLLRKGSTKVSTKVAASFIGASFVSRKGRTEQFLWAVSNFFADVSSKIIALANPVLSQPDMEQEMVSPPTGTYIPSFTIYHVLPDLPGTVDAFAGLRYRYLVLVPGSNRIRL